MIVMLVIGLDNDAFVQTIFIHLLPHIFLEVIFLLSHNYYGENDDCARINPKTRMKFKEKHPENR